ncbi:MAG: holo-ACP synthase [Syntrophobacterales bacterium]|nr:holo-ACP synthase [Syntrophobacterales bacterium]
MQSAGLKMAAGVGIDLVAVARVERILAKWGDAFIRRIYTVEEIAYCQAKARPALHFAACFAVKEAFLKALGTGLGGGIGFNDIATVHDGNGKPGIKLSGKASALQRGGCREKVAVSISHTDDLATAIVILDK